VTGGHIERGYVWMSEEGAQRWLRKNPGQAAVREKMLAIGMKP
jgi:hypothetical protein